MNFFGRHWRTMPVFLLLVACTDAPAAQHLYHCCMAGLPQTGENVVISDRVFFARRRTSLDSQAWDALEKQANWLKKYQSVKVTVKGYAGDGENEAASMRLSLSRAEAVKRFLVESGVSPDRIRVAVSTDMEPDGNRKAVTAIDQ